MLSDDNYNDLKEKGFTVVKDVLTKQECDGAIANYRTWLAEFGDDFPNTYNSVIWGYNVGHMDITWRLRLKAKPIFAQLWKTEKLLTSFDAIAIGRPPEESNETFADPNNHWLHADCTPSKVGLHAYQGALYLEEQTADDWTFQVLEGSHTMLHDFFGNYPERADSARRLGFHFDLSDEDVEYFKNGGCKLTRVPVPKGGLALWDSRLVHANARPLPNRKNADRWRFVTFISMTPAIWANKQDIEKHQQAYNIPSTSSHWSSQGFIFGDGSLPAHPESQFITTLPDIARTEEAMKLSAMLRYDFNDGKPNGDDFRPSWKGPGDAILPPDLELERKYANGHI